MARCQVHLTTPTRDGLAVAERVGGAWRRVGDEIDAVDPRVGIPFDRK